MLNNILKGMGQDAKTVAALVAIGGGLAWFLVWQAKRAKDRVVDSIIPEPVQEAWDSIPEQVKEVGADQATWGPYLGPVVSAYKVADEYRERFWNWLTAEDEVESQTQPGADYVDAWADSIGP